MNCGFKVDQRRNFYENLRASLDSKELTKGFNWQFFIPKIIAKYSWEMKKITFLKNPYGKEEFRYFSDLTKGIWKYFGGKKWIRKAEKTYFCSTILFLFWSSGLESFEWALLNCVQSNLFRRLLRNSFKKSPAKIFGKNDILTTKIEKNFLLIQNLENFGLLFRKKE